MRAKQTDFFLHNAHHSFRDSKKYSHASAFGGSSLKSHPKTARPVSTKHLMHVVLKSDRAKGAHSFLTRERKLIVLARRLGAKLNIQVKDIVVMSNHVHLSLNVSHRRAFRAYLRALAGLVVREIFGTKKRMAPPGENFFSGRPFSRIVAAGRKSFLALAQYFDLNRLEKLGFSKAESRAEGHRRCADRNPAVGALRSEFCG